MINVRVPFVPFERIEESACRFLADHGAADQVPVPIEDVVDRGLRLDVYPLEGLYRTFNVDALISCNLTSIAVDHEVYHYKAHRRRFSLAHEAAHAVIHRAFLEQFSIRTLDEYKHILELLPDQTISRLEWQANMFAGLVLVPSTLLRARFEAALRQANQVGLSQAEEWEVAKSYACEVTAREFDVSPTVVQIRVDYITQQHKLAHGL